jgi:Asp-tRNA(Asn)/Glu-tRNA(Gln) amidotransferase A subunit family amidase
MLVRAALLGCDASVAPLAKPPRIGLCRTPWWSEADADSRMAVEQAAGLLAKAGAQVEEFDLPPDFAGLAQDQKTIMAFDSARALAHERHAHAPDLSPELMQLIEAGEAISHPDYLHAMARAGSARTDLAAAMGDAQFLLAPSAKGEAPTGTANTGDPLFSRMWTLLRVPTISLPGQKGSHGLPIGVQLIGRFAQDDRLLAAARWCEAALA